ncbi:hypothetical protein [uncultured Sphingomonas sp.]|uniref:hypothetical protein n=1 Tax=uncultured Sphingomonas sp. TaxID=158754 RepID=UPI0035CB5B16
MSTMNEAPRNGFIRHRCRRIESVERELGLSRPTATKYLNTLAAAVLLDTQRIGRNNYYINQRLVALFVDGAA